MNRNVFNDESKLSVLRVRSLRSPGNAFQTVGPAEEKV